MCRYCEVLLDEIAKSQSFPLQLTRLYAGPALSCTNHPPTFISLGICRCNLLEWLWLLHSVANFQIHIRSVHFLLPAEPVIRAGQEFELLFSINNGGKGSVAAVWPFHHRTLENHLWGSHLLLRRVNLRLTDKRSNAAVGIPTTLDQPL